MSSSSSSLLSPGSSSDSSSSAVDLARRLLLLLLLLLPLPELPLLPSLPLICIRIDAVAVADWSASVCPAARDSARIFAAADSARRFMGSQIRLRSLRNQLETWSILNDVRAAICACRICCNHQSVISVLPDQKSTRIAEPTRTLSTSVGYGSGQWSGSAIHSLRTRTTRSGSRPGARSS